MLPSLRLTGAQVWLCIICSLTRHGPAWTDLGLSRGLGLDKEPWLVSEQWMW